MRWLAQRTFLAVVEDHCDVYGFTAEVGATGHVGTYFSRQFYLLGQAVKFPWFYLDRFDFAPIRLQFIRSLLLGYRVGRCPRSRSFLRSILASVSFFLAFSSI